MKKFLKIVQSLTKKEKFLTSLIQFNLQLGYSKIYNFLNLLSYGVINFSYNFSINIKIINIFIIQYNYLYIRISKVNYLVFYYIIRLNNNILNKFKLSLFIIKYLIKKIFNNPLIFLKINLNKIFLKKNRTTLSKKKKNIFKWD
jgi:hypothetical protein